MNTQIRHSITVHISNNKRLMYICILYIRKNRVRHLFEVGIHYDLYENNNVLLVK
jgi:hypothetical protein